MLLQPLVPPVVLLGPPGAGKSTVGPLLAQRLGFAFIDLDDVVGVDVLEREGLASFRVREFLALQQAVEGGAVVVAPGAGVVDTGPGRALLARCCCLVLDVDADVALGRIPDGTRPWLPARGDPARAQRWREREQGRVRGGAHVDANAALDVVVDACVAAVEEFVVGEDEDVVKGAPEDGFVVVDDGCGDDGDVVVPVNHKRLLVVEQLLGEFVRRGLTRSDVVVVKGGGILLDTAGLACALYHRGMPWHAVPTTLLAMVDAALGGKTAVDLVVDDVVVRNGAGAFHPPRGVSLETRFLRTLSSDQLRHGRAEMEKHALLGAFDVGAVDDDAIRKSRRVKSFVVRRDPNEKHLRHALNLGHTFAHAFEARFGIAHGDAVLHGLEQALRLSVDVAGFDAAAADAAIAHLRSLGAPALPRCSDDDVDALLTSMARDKKSGRFVLLRAPGRPVLATVARNVVHARLIHLRS